MDYSQYDNKLAYMSLIHIFPKTIYRLELILQIFFV